MATAKDKNPSMLSSEVTLRDHFAGKAIGMADQFIIDRRESETSMEYRARKAYEMADAMLEER